MALRLHALVRVVVGQLGPRRLLASHRLSVCGRGLTNLLFSPTALREDHGARLVISSALGLSIGINLAGLRRNGLVLLPVVEVHLLAAWLRVLLGRALWRPGDLDAVGLTLGTAHNAQG